MTEYSRFFDPSAYDQEQFAEVFSQLRKTGIDATKGYLLKVSAQTPAAMAVNVATGEAWIKGHWYQNTATKAISITAAHATLPRKDLIILRMTVTGSPGKIEAVVLTGTAASSPVAEALTQNASVYEIPLALVDVAAAASSIVAGNITDLRPGLVGVPIPFFIDEGGDPLTTGKKCMVEIPFNCTVLGHTMLSDVTGSIVVDVLHSTYDDYPTTVSIAGTELPTITAARKGRVKEVTTWTLIDLAEGDILEFEVLSCTTITRVTGFIHAARKD